MLKDVPKITDSFNIVPHKTSIFLELLTPSQTP